MSKGGARLLAYRFLPEGEQPDRAEPVLSEHAGIHRNLEPLYRFSDKHLIKTLVRDLPLRTSSLRSLGAAGNVFAIELFMTEIAQSLGVDPIQFRVRHLDDSRAQQVLDVAAERSAAERGQSHSRGGMGVGFARYKNEKAYCAVVVWLEVMDTAEVRIRRSVIVADAGQVIDRQGLRGQLEGGFLQAASCALYEQVKWDDAGITSVDWATYPVIGFDNVGDLETILIDRPNERPLGAGEACIGPGIAAIGNAIADACGVRVRSLPFTREAIQAAALAQ